MMEKMNKDGYIRQLSFVHNMMVASVPLLDFAAMQSEGALKDYFAHHLDEERGHIEILADDLKRLGVDGVALDANAVEVTGAQYYLIAHVHPSALLGYMAALERESYAEDVVSEIEGICGTEMKCLRLHAKLDAQHIKDLDEQIEGLPDHLRGLARDNERYTHNKVMAGLQAISGMEA